MPRQARMMFRGYLVGDSDQIKKGVRIPVQVYPDNPGMGPNETTRNRKTC